MSVNQSFVGCSVGKAFACTVRITALKNCKPVIDPTTGQPFSVVMECITGINTSPFRVEGNDVAPATSCPGKVCWTIKGCTVEKYMQFDRLEFQGWDFDLVALMTANATMTINGNVTIGMDRLTEKTCDIAFALEIWSRVGLPEELCTSNDETLAFYELYPNVKDAQLGGSTRDDTTAGTMVIESARSYPNPAWGIGPYGRQPGGLPLPAKAIERLAFWVDAAGIALPIPVATCTNSGLYPPA
jgi:hypothetical protein